MPERPQLTFEPVDDYRPGDVERLLSQSYEALTTELGDLDPSHFDRGKFDREVFENPGTVGACTFITCLDGDPIGLGSFDPRQRPELGVVGHNCILPPYRGRGYGRLQMLEIVGRLAALGVHTATATTGDHPFFIAAQKMYLACGFHVALRLEPSQDRPFPVIEYRRQLV